MKKIAFSGTLDPITSGHLTYSTNRNRVLNHFLLKAQMGELYLEPYFSALYHQQAIENIEGELKTL